VNGPLTNGFPSVIFISTFVIRPGMAGQATERRARGIQWTWDVSKLEDESERRLHPLEAIKVMYSSDEGLQVIVRRNQRKLRELVKGELDRRRFTLVVKE
jgi:hypothetical protein